MNSETTVPEGTLPTIEEAVQAFFVDFDFGEGGDRTRLTYRSGARAFLRFVKQHEALDLSSPIADLSSSVTADFKAWIQSTEHTGPGRQSEQEEPVPRRYSPATVNLYLQALSRLLRLWWFREWLSFSPEEETRARQALQIQRPLDRRERTRALSPEVPVDFGDRMLEALATLPFPTEQDIPNPRHRC